jgi:polyhydroxybutyrate depolymerase
MRRGFALAAALVALLTGGPAQADCAGQSGACDLPTGEYHIALPDRPVANTPLVVFLHGAGGTGATAIRNSAMLEPMLARGYAVLAPTGSGKFGSGKGRVWRFRGDFGDRDEGGFLQEVVADAARRFGVDDSAVLLSGFSAGGFMVHYLACAQPGSFAAYAPVSGAFWKPHPTTCAGPVRMFHTHGWTDNVVPLEGRYLHNGQVQQGDVFGSLEIWRRANECRENRPDGFDQTGPFLRRTWVRCASGSHLELALHPGGHMVPKGWADMALDWFEALEPRPTDG